MPKKVYISPSPKAYSFNAEALRREQVTDDQVRWDENTIKWGPDDALPLRIMDAVNRSPTTTACLDKIENFIAGAGFTDEELGKMVIDADGTTFWEFHLQLVKYLTLLESFSVNFKFNQKGKITLSYVVGPETVRFVRFTGTKVKFLKQNPYFGTQEYDANLTTVYPVFDPNSVKEEIQKMEDPRSYNGQMYFYGNVKPQYKFYSVPKFWSGEKWIYVDGEIQQFHKSNLQNGFFQSTLINVIGDPNQKSKNPKYQKEVLGSDGTTKRLESTKTVGEEFNDQMNEIFSGSRKAGTAMVLWSKSQDESVKLSSFPTSSNFDILSGTFTDAMRGITTATGVPAILANLPQQTSSLGSDGNSIKAAIDLMHSNVQRAQMVLENFYNSVMFQNMEKGPKVEAKIRPYIPISTQVVVEDKFWEVLSDTEKKEFVKKNVQGMQEVIKDKQIVDEETGEPLTPQEVQVNDKITDLTGRQLQQLNRITRQFSRGEISFEQAKLLLKNGFKFTDLDVNTWLGVEAPVE